MWLTFFPAFLLAISIVLARLKLLGKSRYSLNNQHHLGSKFTLLASNSVTNQFKVATLVHCSLHTTGPQYLSSLLHPYTSSRLLRPTSASISSPNLVLTLLLPLTVFDMCALLFGISSLIPTRTLSSNPIYQLTFSLVQAFLAANNYTGALLIWHNHVEFCVLKLCYHVCNISRT